VIRTAKIRRSILIVEDDSDQLGRYMEMANTAGLAPFGALTLHDAFDILKKNPVQYVLADIHLNGPGRQDTFDGVQLLNEIKESHPEVVPLAMTSDPKIDTYHKVMTAGALYLFRKPILTGDELMVHLEQAERSRRTGAAAKRRRADPALPPSLALRCPDGIVLPQAVRDRARSAALNSTFLPIIIQGETGTGKEEVAKLVHRYRCEADGMVPFVAVNCANLTGETAVSALFGHRKGAFTGAEQTTSGYIGEADGGFLFLDEIQTLTIDCQQRLLRVLNDGSYNRLGDSQTLYSDFRVIVASTKDLEEQVERGTFLVDLSMRLTGINIKLKPLRERLADVPLLIELALARVGTTVPEKTLEALSERCSKYHWQGNVRQLMLVISAMVTEALGDHREINADDLPELKTILPPGSPSPVAASQKLVAREPNTTPEIVQMLKEALQEDRPFDAVIETIERAILKAALARHSSTRSAADALSVARSTLAAKKARYFDE